MAPDLQPAIIYYALPDNCYCVNDFRNRQLKQSWKNRRRFGFQGGFLVEQVMDGGKSSSSHNPTSTELEESCIKNTMQMHEHIFKQQVRELHRLYSVQKFLMGEVKKQQMEEEGTTTLWSSRPLLTASSSDTTSFINLPDKQPLQIRTQDPAKRSGSLDLERPCKEETAIVDELLEDDQVVELTLSIGRKMDNKRCINTKSLNSPLLTESDQGGSVSGTETETSKKEKKKQPFLFL